MMNLLKKIQAHVAVKMVEYTGQALTGWCNAEGPRHEELRPIAVVFTDPLVLKKIRYLAKEMHPWCLPFSKKHEQNMALSEQMMEVFITRDNEYNKGKWTW